MFQSIHFIESDKLAETFRSAFNLQDIYGCSIYIARNQVPFIPG